MRQRALFRCDASAAAGSGHVMRCLAFAEVLRWAGWTCVFATRATTLAAVPYIRDVGHDIQVVESDDEVDIGPDVGVAVVDHYGIGRGFEAKARSTGLKLVAFEDNPGRDHNCDILVDPTPGRQPSAYAHLVPAETQLLLGSDYAMVGRIWQREAGAVRARLSAGPPVRRILVSMGASDSRDATSRVLRALELADVDADIDIVLGAAAPHCANVARVLGPRMRLHVDPPAMAALVARADIVIGTPGSSSFERAVLGVPSILIMTADNQRSIAEAFAGSGAADVLREDVLEQPATLARAITMMADAPDRRRAMSNAVAAIADGRGSSRLLLALAGELVLRKGGRVRLRSAERGDENWLLELQQQPATRRYARNPSIPSTAEHQAWFAATLGNHDRLLTIVEVDGARAGMVRLDRIPGGYSAFEISIAVDERRHGEGIGSSALRLVARMMPGAVITAVVSPDNQASSALFASAGYRHVERCRYRYDAVQTASKPPAFEGLQ
jgi:UDP-2,4-diacetamido-2,4,6-trideoxy-beta-L-altropyranose hydrolase